MFNCQNGTLNLKTFEFKQSHDPCDLLSKVSNVVYDPNKKAPVFEKFINEVMQGDVETTRFLQKTIGYALTGSTSLETCFILYGASTRNGKSTLIETLLYMLGNTKGYAMSMSPETLAQKQNKDSRQASGDIARLKGCRFLNTSEPPKRMVFDVALLKTLLGRDSITARQLFEKEFEFIPIFKLFINTNFLPLITDDTLFSSGRITVIPFNRHFEPHEQDRTLKDRLKDESEISGIFNWCLEGLKMFNSEGLEQTEAIISATEEYRTNSDKLGNFISECLIESSTNTQAKDVYEKYREWCTENGYGTENMTNFYNELTSKGIFSKRAKVKDTWKHNVVLGYEVFNDIDECPFDDNTSNLIRRKF